MCADAASRRSRSARRAPTAGAPSRRPEPGQPDRDPDLARGRAAAVRVRAPATSSSGPCPQAYGASPRPRLAGPQRPRHTTSTSGGMRERTDGQGFATRAIHAGERPGPVDPRAQHADLRDGDVRLRHGGGEGGRGRPGARLGPDRVLLLADRQPDQPGARGEGRVARGRRGLPSSPRRGWRAVAATLFAHLGRGRPRRRGRRAVRDHDGAAGGGPAAARDRASRRST